MSRLVTEFSDDLMHGMSIADDFLEHYGVPGMKWGKRSAQRKAIRKEFKKETAAARKDRRDNVVDSLKAEGRAVKRTAKMVIKHPIALRGTKGAKSTYRAASEVRVANMKDRLQVAEKALAANKRTEDAYIKRNAQKKAARQR